jgi:hypothetical protein
MILLLNLPSSSAVEQKKEIFAIAADSMIRFKKIYKKLNRSDGK